MTALPSSDVPALPAKSGVCLCGCGMTCSKKSFFAVGHDHRVQSFLIAAAFGGTAGLVAKYGHLLPQGGPPNRRLEAEQRKAERAVRDAMAEAERKLDAEPVKAAPKSEPAEVKPAEVKPAEVKPAEVKPRGGPGSGGVPKVKSSKPKIAWNPAYDGPKPGSSKKASKKGGK